MSVKAHVAEHLSETLITHGFFTRRGGASEGLYSSLNCGPGSHDDPDVVIENRRRAVDFLTGKDAPLCTLHQIHSSKVVIVDKPFQAGAPRLRADGLVTKTKGLVLGVLTADCAPVLLADAGAGVIAAAHTGWRGALSGILEGTVAAMESLGAQKQNIRAAIGPCIAQISYEVGEDFYIPFMAEDPANEVYFTKTDKYNFDLEGFIADKLADAGLVNIERLGLDTYTNDGDFFSFRRTTHNHEADYGRQLSAVYLPG